MFDNINLVVELTRLLISMVSKIKLYCLNSEIIDIVFSPAAFRLAYLLIHLVNDESPALN